MTLRLHETVSRRASATLASLAVLALLLLPRAAGAQNHTPPGQDPIQVFHLRNVAQANDASEIMIALRNMVAPTDKIYLLPSTNNIVVSAPPDQVALIGRLITELDEPKPIYRLTYTLTESDGGKRIGVQHFSMVVVTGQQALLKQGDKIPVLTDSHDKDDAAPQAGFTYLDVGLSIEASLDRFAGGLRLRSKVQQTSAAPTQTGVSAQDPVLRQSVLQGTSILTPGRPQTLGSIDVVGSTRHVDIEAVAEPLPQAAP